MASLSAEFFNMRPIARSGCYKIDGVDDAEEFGVLTEQLRTLGVASQTQREP